MTILFMCYSVFSSGSESFCTEDCDHLLMDLCTCLLTVRRIIVFLADSYPCA
jgi:hypothetical protein